MKELADYSRGEGDWVNGDMESTSLAFLLTDAAVFAVVVEQGDVSLARAVGREDAGVMLPADVGGFAVGEVCELVFPTTKDPDWMTVFAIYESEKGEMATRDEIVAVVSL